MYTLYIRLQPYKEKTLCYQKTVVKLLTRDDDRIQTRAITIIKTNYNL